MELLQLSVFLFANKVKMFGVCESQKKCFVFILTVLQYVFDVIVSGNGPVTGVSG